MPHFDKIECAPIIDGGPDDIDEKREKGEDPNKFVAKDIFPEDFFGRKLLFFRYRLLVRIVVSKFFYGREAKRLGGVAQPVHNEEARPDTEDARDV